jgi:hypothetical protein
MVAARSVMYFRASGDELQVFMGMRQGWTFSLPSPPFFVTLMFAGFTWL